MGKANLTYYIVERLLFGTVDGMPVNMLCLSGGGGGTKNLRGPDDPDAVNNPYRTRQKKQSHQRGGPLPPGKYIIIKPYGSGFGRRAFLNPVFSLKDAGRTPQLEFHYRGIHGSDGCIVPMFPEDFKSLMDGLEKDNGGTLWVAEGIGGVMFA